MSNEAIGELNKVIAAFDDEVADELARENERADFWTDVDVPIDLLRRLATALSSQEAEIAELRKALAKLANEVAGLKATEFKVRNVIGDTNWNVLMLRETEARATLAKEPNDGQ